MKVAAKPAANPETLPFRIRQREEMNCQIVHDSIHRREGWTLTFLLERNGEAVGFGSVAIGGPWKDKPTVFEFYVLPGFRNHAFELFEVFVAASGARFFETQSNDVIQTAMVLAYGREISSEKIVFHDRLTTAHPAQGASLRCVTSGEDIRSAIERRQGGGEWLLELDGVEVGKGGILFHYNQPYGDIYMEVNDGFRGRGLGTYLVQELKRFAYELGAIPGARCNPENTTSRRTLTRAGFIPFAHILIGTIAPTTSDAEPPHNIPTVNKS